MDVEIRYAFGVLSGLLMLIGGIISLYAIVRDKKDPPHPMTWVIWTVLGVVGSGGFHDLNAGPGAFGIICGTFVCLITMIYALIYGRNEVKPRDWWFLASSGVCFVLWLVAKQPVYAIFLMGITDGIGFAPTYSQIKQATHRDQLNPTPWPCWILGNLVSLPAFTELTPATVFSTLVMIVGNTVIWLTILQQRRRLLPLVL
jgi:hypothetical protein